MSTPETRPHPVPFIFLRSYESSEPSLTQEETVQGLRQDFAERYPGSTEVLEAALSSLERHAGEDSPYGFSKLPLTRQQGTNEYEHKALVGAMQPEEYDLVDGIYRVLRAEPSGIYYSGGGKWDTALLLMEGTYNGERVFVGEDYTQHDQLADGQTTVRFTIYPPETASSLQEQITNSGNAAKVSQQAEDGSTKIETETSKKRADLAARLTGMFRSKR